jgi:hypothetical protein
MGEFAPPQENFSIIWAKSCNLRTSDPIFREKCCLEKSHFYKLGKGAIYD